MRTRLLRPLPPLGASPRLPAPPSPRRLLAPLPPLPPLGPGAPSLGLRLHLRACSPYGVRVRRRRRSPAQLVRDDCAPAGNAMVHMPRMYLCGLAAGDGALDTAACTRSNERQQHRQPG